MVSSTKPGSNLVASTGQGQFAGADCQWDIGGID